MKALLNVPHPEAIHSIRIMLESVGFKCEMEWTREALLMGQSYMYEPFDIPKNKGGTPDLYVAVKTDMFKEGLKNLLFLINGGSRGKNDFGVPTVTSNFYFNKAFRTYVPWYNRFSIKPREKLVEYEKPVGFLHGGYGWGFSRYFPRLREYVDVWGHRSPCGVLPQIAVKDKLAKTLAFVHLKSQDAPGYALYEAFASATPIILPRFFVQNTMFQDLFIHEETCLMFDNNDKAARDETDSERQAVIDQITGFLERLKDPEENYRIGVNGLFKWRELTRWTSEKRDKFEEYLKQNSLL